MKNWLRRWQELKKKYPRGVLYVSSTLLPMTIMLVVWFFMGSYPFGNKSLMTIVFDQQYISFYVLLKNAILSGDLSSLTYSFTKSIGGDMSGVLGYYLMSPFNIIYVLLPLNYIGLSVFLTIWLRYGAFGLSFAHLLIKRYKGAESKRWMVPLFATAYALSGMLVSYQMNVIFYDAMFMLPLVILYLEQLLDGEAAYPYAFVLGLTVFLQFYMGYMISLFVILYACYYLSPRLSIDGTWKVRLKYYLQPLWDVFLYSILGVAAASILLVPVFFNLLESKGQAGGAMTFSMAFQINPLDILSKLTIGGFDAQSGWETGPNLPNIYIGALGFIGFILYFVSRKIVKERRWAAGVVTLIFFTSFVNEFVNKIWHMGQNPAGFFFRFSWLFSFFMLLLSYQALKEKFKISRRGKLLSVVALVLSAIYLYTKDFTYLPKKQPEALTQFINGHFIEFVILVVIATAAGFYLYRERSTKSQKKKERVLVIATGFVVVLVLLLQTGYLFSRVVLTLLIYLAVLALLHPRMIRLALVLLSTLTVFELGYNAYLSQVTFSYANVDRFVDGTVSVKRVTDNIQENADQPFYRIATTFAYSRTAPSLIGYPGLSAFSSSLERSTMNHFAYMGDQGINEATEYENGTPLTDALYGVRYYMDVKDLDPTEKEAHPERMYFTRFASRFDMHRYFTEKVYEDERYLVYKNPNSFPIAFGVNELVRNTQLDFNDAVKNQNKILNSLEGIKKGQENYVDYFKPLAFGAIETENLVAEDVNKEKGTAIYKREDSSKEAIVRYRITPQMDLTYYFFAPDSLNFVDEYSVLLNGQWFTHSKKNMQRQLWQIADKAAGKESVLEFRFRSDKVDISHVGLYRLDVDQIQKVLEKRKAQGLQVEKFSNTHIVGSVDITDDSQFMLTSIPYSAGWKVKVDGKDVPTSKTWNSLLSFPITSGQHKVEFVFSQKGTLLGLILSLISITILYIDRKYNQKKAKLTSQDKKTEEG